MGIIPDVHLHFAKDESVKDSHNINANVSVGDNNQAPVVGGVGNVQNIGVNTEILDVKAIQYEDGRPAGVWCSKPFRVILERPMRLQNVWSGKSVSLKAPERVFTSVPCDSPTEGYYAPDFVEFVESLDVSSMVQILGTDTHSRAIDAEYAFRVEVDYESVASKSDSAEG